MKFSIIIPTYNSKKWIEECIKSILCQTYTEYDIVILDSGSTDDTLDWIRSINNSRIRIYTTKNRLNISDNWNRIRSISRNEFFTILGHDDVLYPNYLQTINNLIEKFPEASLYQTHFNFIDAESQIIRSCVPFSTEISALQLAEAVLKNTIEITATGFMVRSKDYDTLSGIPLYPNLLYADIELWIKSILKSKLVVSKEITFGFRFHNNNTSKFIGSTRLIAFEMLIDFLCKLKTEGNDFKCMIEKNAQSFIENFAIGTCNKLIYTPKNKRDNITMETITNAANTSLTKLMPMSQSNFITSKRIVLAKLIDSNFLLRKLFLFWKSFSKRTF
jgi:glycosyltransferase involved in cell wall biosynthesis